MPKTLLQIIRCELSGDSLTQTGDTFGVQINPASLKLNRAIEYQQSTSPGRVPPSRFKKYGDRTLSFDVVFDGTGVVPSKLGQSVKDQVDALLQVLYVYQGKDHEPGYVNIVWGDLSFEGRLTSLNTTYTLFSSDGRQLRATVSLSFVAFITATESALADAPSSPDLSHGVTVKSGDTLPLLCHEIYGDQRYYAAVARFNKLSGFRALAPGTRLHFPPLV